MKDFYIYTAQDNYPFTETHTALHLIIKINLEQSVVIHALHAKALSKTTQCIIKFYVCNSI